MAEKSNTLGEIPADVIQALVDIEHGEGGRIDASALAEAREVLKEWVGDNPSRENYVSAQLATGNDERIDPTARRTNKITMTQRGTGLSGQGKTPKI